MEVRKKNVLIIVDTLLTGGAEIFALRLGKALTECCTVTVFCKNANKIDKVLLDYHFPGARILILDGFYLKVFSKIDSLLFRLKIDLSLFDFTVEHYLSRLIMKSSVEVVHSHLSTVDFLTSKAVEKVNSSGKGKVKHVLTVHGDYLQYNEKEIEGKEIYKLLNFSSKLKKLLFRQPEIVCISDKQIDFFKRKGECLGINLRLSKIYNGYQKALINQNQVFKNKQKCQINPDDKVFGMVSRGIPEKGWELAIKAFIKVVKSHTNVHLILVGDSPYLRQLELKYKAYTNLHFVGFTPNPLEWIALFDVGLLPSFYKSESLPTVLIEYLSCKVPALSSDLGEVKKMLSTETGELSGVVLNINPKKFIVNEVAKQMFRFLDDENFIRLMRKNAQEAFSKFKMEDCVTKYLAVYNN